MNGKQLLDSIAERFEMHAKERISTEELQTFITDSVKVFLDETRELVLSMQVILDRVRS
jgi:hypothetical protein